MSAPSNKVEVRLSPDDRERLERVVRSGEHAAMALTRARILLKADAAGADGWSDERIAAALDIHRMTAARVRARFAAAGLDAALHKQPPTGRPFRVLDGGREARLIQVACSQPPGGRARWALRLLADRLVELEVVESSHPSTVQRALNKTTSSRG